MNPLVIPLGLFVLLVSSLLAYFLYNSTKNKSIDKNCPPFDCSNSKYKNQFITLFNMGSDFVSSVKSFTSYPDNKSCRAIVDTAAGEHEYQVKLSIVDANCNWKVNEYTLVK